jgi:DNA-binding MarR family transcriptional regulator
MLHICDNTFCVRFSHLFEGTQQDNINDMLAKGRAADKHGELNPKAKITTKQAQQIRTLYATGEYTTRGLAKQFGLASKSSIGSILKGKSW